ncbi:MAG: Xaa-Pro peptidase family protein [Armatimonadota bacterium]|nr:Xaa-Pro peptidase family protein [Armatimonadota bacterium]MDR7496512.1 Xaa-Pro peptidase family protein [Armatimonadota bacterium]
MIVSSPTGRQPRFADFPREEYVARVRRARALMASAGLDALVVTGKENVIYYTGLLTIGWISKHRPLGAIIAHDHDAPLMIVPESLLSVAEESSWIDEVRPWGGVKVPGAPADPIDAFLAGMRELGLTRGRIGMELGYGQRIGMPQADVDAFRAALSDATLVDASGVLWAQRMVKSPLEIEAIRRACAATTRAFEVGFGALREGMTERELAGIMLRELASTNYPPGFIMVRSGVEKYRMINVEPFDKPMRRGDLVIVDAGATYRSYWSDYMRMACIGEPTPEQRRFFAADLASQSAGVAAVRAGVQAGAIFQACQNAIEAHGLSEHAALERIGHGVGLDVHEPPSLARGSTTVIEEGMVLTVEPIFWDQPHGRIGNFALEDVLVVTKDGHEVLSRFPKDLYVVA